MGIYHWSRKTKMFDKIHTPRIVPQKLERTPSDTSRSRGCHCFYAGWL
ncbi:hypothetical protein ACNKHW_19225 [Shigella flexneri]